MAHYPAHTQSHTRNIINIFMDQERIQKVNGEVVRSRVRQKEPPEPAILYDEYIL